MLHPNAMYSLYLFNLVNYACVHCATGSNSWGDTLTAPNIAVRKNEGHRDHHHLHRTDHPCAFIDGALSIIVWCICTMFSSWTGMFIFEFDIRLILCVLIYLQSVIGIPMILWLNLCVFMNREIWSRDRKNRKEEIAVSSYSAERGRVGIEPLRRERRCGIDPWCAQRECKCGRGMPPLLFYPSYFVSRFVCVPFITFLCVLDFVWGANAALFCVCVLPCVLWGNFLRIYVVWSFYES